MPPKLLAFVLPFLVVVPADQLTKLWVEGNIAFGGELPVIEGFFWLTHVQNSGIVFGWFQGGAVVLFAALTLLAMGLIVAFYRQVSAEDRLSALALGMILGGAVGNLIDRLFRGAVVDFLRFDLHFFIYPDFNVADSAIVVGVALLLLRRNAWFEADEGRAQAAAE